MANSFSTKVRRKCNSRISKCALIVGTHPDASYREKFAQVRAQFHHGGGLAATGSAGLQRYTRRNLARTAETLKAGKTVVSPKAANGLALAPDEGQRRVRTDQIAEPPEFPINPVLPERWLEGEWIKKYVNIF